MLFRSETDCVLYLGQHTLYYLLGDYSISNYSTISTPTFDDRLLDYWTLFPEKYPTIIIADSTMIELDDLEQLLPQTDCIIERDNIHIYKVNR